MASLTENESGIMDFLARNFSEEYNINQLSRKLDITPWGMLKILRKLESQKFLVHARRGNNVFYRINYDSPDALDACTFALTRKKMIPYVKVLAKEIEGLMPATKLAIIFGSVLTKGRKANDIDILLAFDKKNIRDVEHFIDRINKIKPKRIHSIYQTRQDLIKNIRGRDSAILEEIRTGVILWGRGFLIQAIKDGQN